MTEYVAPNGPVVAHFEYDPFGNTTAATGTMAAEFAHRFSTKHWDPETGLYYYGYRFYCPRLGRWVSRDPIGETAGIAIYPFVANATMTSADYLGLIEPDINLTEPGGEADKAIKGVQDPPNRATMAIVYAHSGLEDRRGGPKASRKFLTVAELTDELYPHLEKKCSVVLIVCYAGKDTPGEKESSVVARMADLLRIRARRNIWVHGPEGLVLIGKEGTAQAGTLVLEDGTKWILRPNPPPPKETKQKQSKEPQ